ncbi:hypothetical protein PAECIP111893_01827 [Paenibacillus plantiphilus]|uniref:Fibronectin type-III domain-containing protein n=1 Tax=Paenibacillus plantiphilus TaxID=2905650 RepID=A0ABM9C5S3_9BACL|nr:fibronectin type III domain-containing protein [Paenibacillus plantiphilus]CAH1202544.1 hypothetical protein PAECIP111893_01827 [Paenibacillus plantiphilus]
MKIKRILLLFMIIVLSFQTLAYAQPDLYVYDENNRLTHIEFEKDGKQYRTSYTYDNSGNMVNQITEEIEGSSTLISVGDFKKISAGPNNSFGIKDDGTLWGWGDNLSGQLGLGPERMNDTQRKLPVLVEGIQEVEEVSAGLEHTISLKQDGTVWAWGNNDYGQLGIGTHTLKTLPEQVTSLSGVAAVAAGNNYSIALKSDGTVWSWGANDSGQLGDGTTTNRSIPVQVSGISSVVAISAGETHTIAIKSDGTVWNWGDNAFGQIGNGTTINTSIPVQVLGISDVTKIAAGNSHSIAVKRDGTVWAWGNNDNGKLGNGTTTDTSMPVQVNGLHSIRTVSAGESHSVAVNSDGEVWAWGVNGSGQLGDGTTINRSSPVQVLELSSVIDISVGSNHSMVIQNDGTAWTWGSYGQIGAETSISQGLPIRVKQLNSVIAISAGQEHSLALQDDGTVWAWGKNNYSQLGDGTTINSASPLQVKELNEVRAISAGYNHNLVLKKDGTVWAWGWNGYGQLGDGTTEYRRSPVQVQGLSSIVKISAGQDHSIVVKSDGTVWAWGLNNYGQLGNGTEANSATPVQVSGLNGISEISARSYHSTAIDKSGEVWTWGRNLNYEWMGGDLSRAVPIKLTSLYKNAVALSTGKEHGIVLKSDGSVWEWGYSYNNVNRFPFKWADLNDFVAASAGSYFSIAVRSDGTVWTWGVNDFGQLGDGTMTNRSQPAQISNLDSVISVSSGKTHSIALKSDGTIWGWGSDDFGQLGNGISNNKKVPIQLESPDSFVMVAAGESHSLGIESDGTVWAWGDNTYGQLGDGTTIRRGAPVKVNDLNSVIAVSVGSNFSVALKSDGTVWAWGYNGGNGLGDGTFDNKSSPVHVLGIDSVVSISSGGYHTLALKRNGTVWGWGYNGSEQVGSSVLGDYARIPTRVFSNDVVAISAGYSHSLAVKSDGTVWGWGSNTFGQRGSYSIYGQVYGLTSVIGIAGGSSHSLALKSDGTVWSWGNNSDGQLGDGTTVNRSSPVQITGLNSISEISTYGRSSIALKNDGTLWTWGLNSSGQLGDGTSISKSSPIKVKTLDSIITASAGYKHSTAIKSDGTVWIWGSNQEHRLNFGNIFRQLEGTYFSSQNVHVTHTKTETNISLSWLVSEVNEAEIVAYEIYQGLERVAESTAKQFQVTGLNPATRYLFRVKGKNAAGQVVAESGLIPISTTPDITNPMAPTGLQLLNKWGTYAHLVWNASTDNIGIVGYEVLVDGVVKGTFTNTSGMITGLEANRTYIIAVRAYDAAGNRSNASAAIVSRLLPDTTIPTTPIVQAEQITESGVTLNWQPARDNVDVVAYEIKQNQTVIATQLKNKTSLVVTDLKPNTLYTFAVTALDRSGNRSAAGTVQVTTMVDNTAPSVPTGIQINSYTTDSISLTWKASTDNTVVAGYDIYRDGVLAGSSLLPTYVVVGLQPNVTYTFTIKAKDAVGHSSAFSEPFTAHIIPDTEAPSIPNELEADVRGEREVTLRWQPATDNVGVVSYTILRNNEEVGTSSIETFTDVDLQSGTAYTYTVQAKDMAGNLSPVSPGVTVSTRGDAVADQEAPSIPQSLAVENRTESSLDLVWLPSTDNVSVSSYEIYDGTTLLGTSATNRFTFNQIDAETAYSFTVRAQDAAGNWSASSSALHIGGDTVDTEAPSAPTNLTAAVITETTVQLSWTASTDNIGITGYDIYNGSTVVGSVNGAATAFTVTNLTAGTSYTFTVKAKDAAGNVSAASEPLSVTTTTAPSNSNLLLNGGFETYTGSGGVADNWTKSFTTGVTAAFQPVSTPVAEGSQAQQLSGSGLASGDNVKIHQIAAIEPNSPYTVSGQFKVESLTAAKVQLYVDFLDASNAIVGTARAEHSAVTSGYITLEKSGVVPASTAKAKVYAILRGTGAGGTGSFIVDDMRFIQAAPSGDTQAPSAPTNLIAMETTESTVNLSWTTSADNIGVTGYDIYNGSTLTGSVNGGATTFTVTNLTAGTPYTFTVKAKDAAGNISAVSDPLSVTTAAAPSNPNLLLNGGFETYTGSGGVGDNWIKSFTAGVTASFQMVSTPVAEGGQAQQITGSGLASGDTVKIHQITAIEPNSPYTVSGQFMVGSLTATKVQLYVDFLDAGNAIVGTARVEQLATTSGYITLEKSGVSPTTAVKAKVYAILRGTGAGGAGSFEVDAMSFTQSPADPQTFSAPHGATEASAILHPFWRMPAAFSNKEASNPFTGWFLAPIHN